MCIRLLGRSRRITDSSPDGLSGTFGSPRFAGGPVLPVAAVSVCGACLPAVLTMRCGRGRGSPTRMWQVASAHGVRHASLLAWFQCLGTRGSRMGRYRMRRCRGAIVLHHRRNGAPPGARNTVQRTMALMQISLIIPLPRRLRPSFSYSFFIRYKPNLVVAGSEAVESTRGGTTRTPECTSVSRSTIVCSNLAVFVAASTSHNITARALICSSHPMHPLTTRT